MKAVAEIKSLYDARTIGKCRTACSTEIFGGVLFTDNDADGYCAAPSVWLKSGVYGGDCNDQNAAIRPNAYDLCDGVDNNCDGELDKDSINNYISTCNLNDHCGSFTTVCPTGQECQNNACAVISASLTCANQPPNLLGWWRADGRETLRGGAVLAAGKVGRGFSFNGLNDYVEIPNSNNLQLSSNQFTLSAWVYLREYSAGGAYILQKLDNVGYGPGYGLWVYQNSLSGVFFSDKGPATSEGLSSGSSSDNHLEVRPGKWYHVAMTYDGTSLKSYVDGQPDKSKTIVGAIITPSTAPLKIGPGGVSLSNEIVDEVQVYGRALSAAEILGIYQAGSKGVCVVDSDNDGVADDLELLACVKQLGSGKRVSTQGLNAGCQIGDINADSYINLPDWNMFLDRIANDFGNTAYNGPANLNEQNGLDLPDWNMFLETIANDFDTNH